MGFLLTAVLNVMNGLHFYFPAIPQLCLRVIDIGHFFTNKPWNAVGWTPLVIYPWIVGMIFFIPTDLSFSCWFFYLFAKAQRIISNVVGWDTSPNFPYFDQQVTGGWLFLLFIALFLMKKYLKKGFITVFNRDSKSEVEPSFQILVHCQLWSNNSLVQYANSASC